MSSYERKLVQEIIKPGGATKRPQETVLNNFVHSAQNLDAVVVCSILYHVLQEAQPEHQIDMKGRRERVALI